MFQRLHRKNPCNRDKMGLTNINQFQTYLCIWKPLVIFPDYFDQIIYLYLSACNLNKNHSYNINTLTHTVGQKSTFCYIGVITNYVYSHVYHTISFRNVQQRTRRWQHIFSIIIMYNLLTTDFPGINDKRYALMARVKCRGNGPTIKMDCQYKVAIHVPSW